LREIKHNCRIPVKNGWLLPGIADEGPTYETEGETNVYTLNAGEIFGDLIILYWHGSTDTDKVAACVQSQDDEEPKWITGRCIIWRSPIVSMLTHHYIRCPDSSHIHLGASWRWCALLAAHSNKANADQLHSATGIRRRKASGRQALRVPEPQERRGASFERPRT
jgi:hypothetical protein